MHAAPSGAAPPSLRWGLYGSAAAALGAGTAWGFTVDDALISTRVAHQLARGNGYRFNVDGPIVDAVTPLGWAHLVAPFASDGPWRAMTVASVGGAVLWVFAAGWLGIRVAQVCSGARRWLALAVLAGSLPLGAWAVSGMETALVMALGVFALAPGAAGAVAAGLAAALRPELVPWAATLAFGGALARREPPQRRAALLGLALAPALLVAALRHSVFGRAAPLAVYAKPSDVEHGIRYVFGVLFLSGAPWLLVAWRSWRSATRDEWAIAAALGAHLLVLLGVGGDWMPFWRLAMPVLPGVLVLGAALSERSSTLATAARLLAAAACSVLLHAQLGPDARRVRSERARILAQALPALAGARRVASVDIGWVGAAGEHHVVDLAGVADPEVAFLPGGHTSKRLPADFLERRDVDALVLSAAAGAAPDDRASFRHAVERRAMSSRGAERFELRERIRLDARWDYWILRRRRGELP